MHVASGNDVGFGAGCHNDEDWEADHDPPLRTVGSFHPADDEDDCGHTDHCLPDEVSRGDCEERCRDGSKLYGTYRVSCGVDCWVVDLGEELEEAVGGIMGTIVLLIIMIILVIAGAILLCVACCCCFQGPDKPAPVPQAVPMPMQPA